MRKHLATIAALAFGFSATAQGQDLNLTSEGKVPGQPFQALQQQIDALEEQIAQIQSQPAFQFVGFTAATLDGGQGLLTMHNLCRTEFGPEARMCESREFALSPSAVAPVSKSAWVHPTLVGGNGSNIQIDYSGAAGSNFPCSGWNSISTGSGLVVFTTGRIRSINCSFVAAVTCCAPAASP